MIERKNPLLFKREPLYASLIFSEAYEQKSFIQINYGTIIFCLVDIDVGVQIDGPFMTAFWDHFYPKYSVFVLLSMNYNLQQSPIGLTFDVFLLFFWLLLVILYLLI